MGKHMIQFKDFTFKYDSQTEPTLKDINLSIKHGEKVVIVGPSGSGKSTIGHCLNGLIPFSYKGDITGSLTIAGQETKLLNIFEISKMLGTVLQDPDGQFIGLTVGEDISFYLENDGVKQSVMKEKVAEVAQLVEIEDKLLASVHELSGGQRQRVALGGVLVEDVDVLLFDEPLANLDPATGRLAIRLIDQIHKQLDCTVVIIEHRLEDVLAERVDRIIVMENGQIKSDMTPNELLATDVLTNTKLREPLYVTALKYAGCQLDAGDDLASFQDFSIEKYIEPLKSWAKQLPTQEEPVLKEPLLEVKNLSFAYEEKSVLQQIDFSVYQGEMISVVGKNGAGKSTLSRLICGFERGHDGDILFDGHVITNDSIASRAQKIGMVMQNPNHMISKHMIFDEIAFGLEKRGVPTEEISKRVEEVLKICGLYPYRNWPISALSFGQKKRVTIASILVLNPKIIILDEPTAGQDFYHYTLMMEFLQQLNKRGITIIIVTHDMHVMLEYTTRSLVLVDGELMANGTPAYVLEDDTVIQQAHLKQTSIYELARRARIEDPANFVRQFIAFDREARKLGK